MLSLFLIRTALVCCTVFFTLVLGIAVRSIGWLPAAAAALLLGALTALYRAVRRLRTQTADRLFAACFAFFCLLLAACGYLLEVLPAWDFGWVYFGALDLTTSRRITWTAEYFLESLNNLFPAMLEAPLLVAGSKLGIQPPHSLVASNALFIALAVLLLTLGVRRIAGPQAALLSLLLCMGCAPFYLYVPIPYTDTFSLPVVALLFYLAAPYLAGRADALPGAGAKGRRPARVCRTVVLCGVLSALGCKIKPTALFFPLALLLAVLLYHPKAAWRPALACLAVCIALLAAYRLWLPRSGVIDLTGLDARRLPPLHYLMMGLAGNGGYNEADHLASRALPDAAARNAYAIQQITQRLGQMGLSGLLRHIAEKLAFTWADGCYYAQHKLAIDPVRPNPLHELVLPGGSAWPFFSFVAGSMQLARLFLIVALCWHTLRRPQQAGLSWAVLICLLGAGLFLLVWETRSRYLVNLLPLMLVASLQGLAALNKRLPPVLPLSTNKVITYDLHRRR